MMLLRMFAGLGSQEIGLETRPSGRVLEPCRVVEQWVDDSWRFMELTPIVEFFLSEEISRFNSASLSDASVSCVLHSSIVVVVTCTQHTERLAERLHDDFQVSVFLTMVTFF